MNKSELVEALAARLEGDKKTAAKAVDEIVDLVLRSVVKGEKVSIAGFGVFEKRARAARTARNPATGESIKLKKTNVPAFRPGTQFKNVVAGKVKLGAAPKPAKKAATKTAAVAAKSTAVKKTTAAKATKTTATKTAAKAPAKKVAKAPAKKAAKKTAAKKAPAKR